MYDFYYTAITLTTGYNLDLDVYLEWYFKL